MGWMLHGGAAPWWVAVMSAAERWGVAPWVVGGGGALRWFLRLQEVERVRKAAK